MNEKEYAKQLFDIITNKETWENIQKLYNEGAYNNSKINPHNSKITNFADLKQRAEFWINCYEKDLLSEAPHFLNLISNELNTLIQNEK